MRNVPIDKTNYGLYTKTSPTSGDRTFSYKHNNSNVYSLIIQKNKKIKYVKIMLDTINVIIYDVFHNIICIKHIYHIVNGSIIKNIYPLNGPLPPYDRLENHLIKEVFMSFICIKYSTKYKILFIN